MREGADCAALLAVDVDEHLPDFADDLARLLRRYIALGSYSDIPVSIPCLFPLYSFGLTWDIDAEVVVGMLVIARMNKLGMEVIAHELAIGVGLGVVNPTTAHLVVVTFMLDSKGPATDTVATFDNENGAS